MKIVECKSKEYKKKYMKLYRQKNKEKIRLQEIEYKKRNQEKIRKQKRLWRLHNPQKIKEMKKRYWLKYGTKINTRKRRERLKKRKINKKEEIRRLRASFKPNLNNAIIFGHLMGDGHLGKNNVVAYANKEISLIQQMKKCMLNEYDSKPYSQIYKGCHILQFHKRVGKQLNLIEDIKGNKLYKNFQVPKFILKGNQNIKRGFIRAIFDDEAWVTYCNGPCIGFCMSKIESKEESLINFFSQLKLILLEFGVKTRKNHIVKIQHKDENRSKITFKIGSHNLTRFHQNISFLHPNKNAKLKCFLDQYSHRFKGDSN